MAGYIRARHVNQAWLVWSFRRDAAVQALAISMA